MRIVGYINSYDSLTLRESLNFTTGNTLRIYLFSMSFTSYAVLYFCNFLSFFLSPASSYPTSLGVEG